MAEAKAEARAAAEGAVEALARTVLSLLAGALPALCARHGEGEVRAVLRALLPALQAEPRVSVRLHPRLVPGVQAELAGFDADLAAAGLGSPAILVVGEVARLADAALVGRIERIERVVPAGRERASHAA